MAYSRAPARPQQRLAGTAGGLLGQLGQQPVQPLMQGTATRPVAQQPRPITGVGRGKAEPGGVLAHGVEVDQ
ncbi:hypothetical protein D3C73_1550080 [compost metagenome]